MLHIYPQPLRYFYFKDEVLLVAQVGLKLRTMLPQPISARVMDSCHYILLNNEFFGWLVGWLMLGMALYMLEKHHTKMHLHFMR